MGKNKTTKQDIADIIGTAAGIRSKIKAEAETIANFNMNGSKCVAIRVSTIEEFLKLSSAWHDLLSALLEDGEDVDFG